MSVHYKFKASNDVSTVTFDGIHISVGDLKREIIEQKKLGKNVDFDLQIQNAQTKEVYEDEKTLIPKNTSVTIARIPLSDFQKKKAYQQQHQGQQGQGFGHGGGYHNYQQRQFVSSPSSITTKGTDLTSLDLSEEEKIKAMMAQSTADYDPSKYVRLRGQGQYGRVPDSYRCHKCHQTGHWVKNCPLGRDGPDIKKTTGIPRSFMVPVEGPQVPGALITPQGQYVVSAVDMEGYKQQGKKPGGDKPEKIPDKPVIPSELVCPLCQDLLTEAVMVPCCAVSYCDECIRSSLIESDDQECPGCHEKEVAPANVIPNRFLRTAVNSFKNETGYEKENKIAKEDKRAAAAAERQQQQQKQDEQLPTDLFPHSPIRVEGVEGQQQEGLLPTPLPALPAENIKTGNDESSSTPTQHQSPFVRQDINTPVYDDKHLSAPQTSPYHQRGPPPTQQARPPPNYPYNRSPSYHHQYQPGTSPNRHGHGHGSPHHSQYPHPLQQYHGHGPPPPMGRGGPPPQGPNPFDQQQHPPPGYHQPHNMPPGGPGPPPPGYGHHGPPPQFPPPPQHQHGFQHPYNHNAPPQERFPPPIYGHGPPPGGPYHHPPHHMGRPPPFRTPPYRQDDNPIASGVIEDPLKEFERIMREKDRRKMKRSPSPFLQRSRSRSPVGVGAGMRKGSASPFPPRSRSPSPKRTRVAPPPPPTQEERGRLRSLSPPPPMQQRRPHHGRSRSPPPYHSGHPHHRKEEYYRNKPRFEEKYERYPPSYEDKRHSLHSDKRPLEYDKRPLPHPDHFDKRGRERERYRPYDKEKDYHHRGQGRYSEEKTRHLSGEGKPYQDNRGYHHQHPHPSDKRVVMNPEKPHQHDKPPEPYKAEQSQQGGSGMPPSLMDINISPPKKVKAEGEEKPQDKSANVGVRDDKPQKEDKHKEKEKRTKSSEERKVKKEKKHKKKKDKKEKGSGKVKRRKSKSVEADKPKDVAADNKEYESPSTADDKDIDKEKTLPSAEKAEINSAGDIITAAPDSTVQSPEHHSHNQDLQKVPTILSNENKTDTTTEAKDGDKSLPLSTEVEREDEDDTHLSNETENDEKKEEAPSETETRDEKSELSDLPSMASIPPSKWENEDLFHEETFEEKLPLPEDKAEKLPLPPEVLRRAESAIFEPRSSNMITVQSISVSLSNQEDSGEKKITLTNIGSLSPPPNKSPGEDDRRNSDGDDQEDKGKLSSAVFRRPLRDRLGSKVSEDEAASREKARSYRSNNKSPPRNRSRSPLDKPRTARDYRDYSRDRPERDYPPRGERRDSYYPRNPYPPRERERGREQLPPRSLPPRDNRDLSRREREREPYPPRGYQANTRDNRRSPLPYRPPYNRGGPTTATGPPPPRERKSSEREPTPPGVDKSPRQHDKPTPTEKSKPVKRRINLKLASAKDAQSSSSEEEEQEAPKKTKKQKKAKKKKKASSSSSAATSSSSSDEKQKKKKKAKKHKKKKKKKSK